VSLTGVAVLLVIALLAVTAPFACLWAWSRVPGGRWRGGTLRFGLVAVCQVTTVALVGVVVNDAGGFYSSWSDLLGTSSSAPLTQATAHFGAGAETETAFVSAASPIADVQPASIPAAAASWKTSTWSKRADWPTKGAVVNTTFKGPTTGLSEPAMVYLPPAYFHTGQAARSIPVVEVFTGFPGVEHNLVSRLRYPDQVLSGIQKGTAGPMVLVMLQPAPSYPWDTECTNVPHGPQTMNYFTNDVPALVTSMFGLQPTGWGTMGDSTGGYCAAKVQAMDPARFTAAVSLSGYTEPSTDYTTRGIFAGNQNLRDQNDLLWRLQHLPPPRVSLLVATARDEHGTDGYTTALKWLHAVKAPMQADELALPHGGHNFRSWNREIPFALTWISAHLPQPKA
jgi:S-formylglutathione hydrolase FrmB